MRLKYGFLLKVRTAQALCLVFPSPFFFVFTALHQNFTETNTLPVFRTESQCVLHLSILCNEITLVRNRMLASAMNFAMGFFGYPFEDQYQQSITIEADGVCPLGVPSLL
jgi:hypothetical protein